MVRFCEVTSAGSCRGRHTAASVKERLHTKATTAAPSLPPPAVTCVEAAAGRVPGGVTSRHSTARGKASRREGVGGRWGGGVKQTVPRCDEQGVGGEVVGEMNVGKATEFLTVNARLDDLLLQ